MLSMINTNRQNLRIKVEFLPHFRVHSIEQTEASVCHGTVIGKAVISPVSLNFIIKTNGMALLLRYVGNMDKYMDNVDIYVGIVWTDIWTLWTDACYIFLVTNIDIYLFKLILEYNILINVNSV